MINDKFPKDINLSKRLETRFVHGATMEMKNPGYETRMQILKFHHDQGYQYRKKHIGIYSG